ncbi:PPK2 family polyphosphate kinase [Massilia sp. W12]|uniref:PPK2 family polyphosphate kinase n=1 Tax=Massilia sp. W12 TaxID=3126507 RepID=UPI0030CAE144
MKTCALLRLPANWEACDDDAARLLVGSGDKQQDKAALEAQARRIGELQQMLYAQQKQKLLVILQGMDGAGKDRSIAASFAYCNMMGLRAKSFKAPTPQELAHDFLWRVHAETPACGQIGIFNRSHYEDVLVPRVHGQLDAAACRQRYTHIRAFESLLAESGTRILKIFLHISQREQARRLQERLQDPEKQWKFDPSDLRERGQWKLYQQAYADALHASDAEHAPWHIVPADNKPQRNLAVSCLIAETLADMQPAWPAFRPELAQIKVE